MAFTATLRSGNPLMIDYTPAAGNVAAGAIVLIGNTTGWTCGIAHKDIVNNVQGELAAGGGVYDVKVLSNYAAGTKVYWDAANSVLTSTSTNMSLFGYTAVAVPAVNTVSRVIHDPRA